MFNSNTIRHFAWLPLGATIVLCSSPALAQNQSAIQEPVAQSVTPPPTKSTVRILDGTEVRVRLDDTLSSKTASVGDEFSITLDEPIRLADGTVISEGYRGRGSVTAVHKVEMMGKAGELSLRLDYIRIGDTRVHLRGNQGGEGKSMQSTAIALSLLVTPLFLLRHGHDMVFPKGQHITAYVDEDASILLPVTPPPGG